MSRWPRGRAGVSMQLWTATIGYLFAVVVGGVLISLVSRKALHRIGMPTPGRSDDAEAMANPWTAVYVGIIERILYVSSLQLGTEEFIGLWLGLKVAGGWTRWSEKRKIFQIFLIGSGLSVMYAAVGFKLIGWLQNCRSPEWWLVPATLVAFTVGLWAWLRITDGSQGGAI